MFSKYKKSVTKLAEKWLKGILPPKPFLFTYLGLMFALLSAYEIYMSNFFLAAVFLAFSGLCDALDGISARIYKKQTKWGWFLDSFLDRVGEGIIYLALAVYYPVLATLALLTSYLVSYARAKVDSLAVGIGERGERLLILFLGFLLKKVKEALLLVSIIAAITALQRVLLARKILTQKQRLQ